MALHCDRIGGCLKKNLKDISTECMCDDDEDNVIIRSKCLNDILSWYKKNKEAKELVLDIEISTEQKYWEKGYHSALMCIEEILVNNDIIEKENIIKETLKEKIND